MKNSNLNLFAAVAVSTIIGIVGASAADLPVKARSTVTAPAVSWTGCYIGANAGWIGGADILDNYPGPTVVALAPLTLAQVATASHSYKPQGSGFAGGAQVGCNWQAPTMPLLFGVEMDFNGASLKESTNAFIPDDGFFAPHTEVVTKDIKWFSTFRAREGFVWDRLLLYVTGGLAVAQINSSQSFAFPSPPGFGYFGTDSRTRTGYAVGVGEEYAFTNNWLLKVEYLYLDFGRYTFASRNSVFTNASWATDVRPREHIVRVGLNYKFDWGQVVAKY